MKPFSITALLILLLITLTACGLFPQALGIKGTPAPTPFAGGGKIAFWSMDGEYIDYYLMNPDGTGVKRIFSARDIEVPGNWNSLAKGLPPSWSPSGRYLLFYYRIRNLSYRPFLAYLYDTVSEEVQLVFQVAGLGETGTCAWSPDERYIICSRNIYENEVRNFEEGGLYKISLKDPDRPEFVLPSTPELDITALVSVLDEDLYLVKSYQNKAQKEGLFIINQNGDIEQVIFADSLDETAFRANILYHAFGNKIAPGSYFFLTTNAAKDWTAIYQFDLTDETLTKITEIDGNIYSYSASPDGRQLAYLSSSSLRVIDVESKQVTAEFEGDFQKTGVSWSPDGNYLVFSRRLSDQTFPTDHMYRIDLAAGKMIELVPEILIEGAWPIWSP